jgi:hypothetical protein
VLLPGNPPRGEGLLLKIFSKLLLLLSTMKSRREKVSVLQEENKKVLNDA